MNITLLGTGTSQGVPVIGCECSVCRSLDFRDKRLRSSLHIEVDGVSIVIDSGPDFRQQILREGIKKMDALLFTHEHKDHTAGMDDIRSFNFLQKKDMPIYGDQRVINQLKQEFSYVFQESKYPGVPKVEVHEIKNSPFQVQGISVLPIQVMHHKLPVYGFRIKDFTYITDAKTINETERAKIKGSKVLIINALQVEDHISHLTLAEAITLSQELDVEQTYFTHISHKLGGHKSVSDTLPATIKLGNDGLKISM